MVLGNRKVMEQRTVGRLEALIVDQDSVSADHSSIGLDADEGAQGANGAAQAAAARALPAPMNIEAASGMRPERPAGAPRPDRQAARMEAKYHRSMERIARFEGKMSADKFRELKAKASLTTPSPRAIQTRRLPPPPPAGSIPPNAM